MSWSIKAFREKNLGLATLIPHDGARDNWTQSSVRSAHLLSTDLYLSSTIMYLLLDGLVCSIVRCFYLSLVFGLALLNYTAWLVKISRDATH